MIKYSAQITEMGPLTTEFIDAGILVFFGAEAPEELREFAIMHDGTELKRDVAPGDMICLGDSCFSVLAVGEVANKNLAALGHFIVKFNGETTPEMPGDICVELQSLPEIKIGMRIEIKSA